MFDEIGSQFFITDKKTLREKKKLLVMSNFSFSFGVFKKLVLQTRKNQGLFGKGLNDNQLLFTTQSRLSTTLRKMPLENVVEKGENACYHFLLSPTMFSTIPKPNFKGAFTFILSSANASNLDQSKIL